MAGLSPHHCAGRFCFAVQFSHVLAFVVLIFWIQQSSACLVLRSIYGFQILFNAKTPSNPFFSLVDPLSSCRVLHPLCHPAIDVVPVDLFVCL